MKLFSHIKNDLPASIIVFFVALPLCLGIALASGAPLFSGIIAGVIGGIVVGSLSGSALGVSGPAAGLATIVFANLAELGSWEAFLLVVVIAGVIQLIAGFLNLGTIAYYFPPSVIKGMLAGIGLIIIIKQIPHLVGYDADIVKDYAGDGINYLANPQLIMDSVTPGVVFISAISLSMMIFWDMVLSKKHVVFRAFPSPLAAVVLGVILFALFNHNILPFALSADHLVKIPLFEKASDLAKNFAYPDFSYLSNSKIYVMALIVAIVASLETLLSLEATDNLDPQRRVSPTNRELKAQGVGNIVSGLIGGLPITQVIVRSSANLSFGAKTKLSTIIHGFILLIAVVSIPAILNMIPLASLACILIIVGYKLINPKIIKEMYKAGHGQFLPFITTIIAMACFDLLTGVACGVVVAFAYLIRINPKQFYKGLEKFDARNTPAGHLVEEEGLMTLTREVRDSITPQEAIKRLKDGNKRFINNLKLNRNLLSQVNETSREQHPFAVILSCIDSRTSAELIFDQGLGDIFSVRIAGNVLNDDIIGSMEFACKIAGAKLIMVLGHTGCGAIKGACDDVEMGKLTSLLRKIRPAIKLEKKFRKDRTGKNDGFVDNVAKLNVRVTMNQIGKQSRILSHMVERGEIAVIGGMYDVGTGVVAFENL